MVVLGAAQCGKSSLVQRLLHGTAHPNTVHAPTEGVRVDLWTPFKTQELRESFGYFLNWLAGGYRLI